MTLLHYTLDMNQSGIHSDMDIKYEINDHQNSTTNITEIINASNGQSSIDFQYYAWGVAGTTIAALGLVGNILSIIVLAHRRMRSATSCYLIALSVYDCLVLIALVLFMSLPVVYLKTKRLQWYYDLYSYLHPYAYPLALTAQTCSIYTTVGFTIERYIAVCFPLKAASWCTISRARKGVLIILLVSILYNIPRMLEYRTITITDDISNTTRVHYNLTQFGANQLYRHIYLLYLHMVIMLIIPFTVLAVLNTMLIRAVRKSQNAKGKVTNKQHRENNLTIMLISVIVVFLICQVPSIADNILAVTLDPKTTLSPPFVRLTVICSLCVIMNSATNFYLYCLFGHKFRRLFCYVLCQCLAKNKNLDRDTTVIIKNSLKPNYNQYISMEKGFTKQRKSLTECSSVSAVPPADAGVLLTNNNTTTDQHRVNDSTGDEGQSTKVNGKACVVTSGQKAYYTSLESDTKHPDKADI